MTFNNHVIMVSMSRGKINAKVTELCTKNAIKCLIFGPDPIHCQTCEILKFCDELRKLQAQCSGEY